MTTNMPTHHDINCETGVVTERPFTQEEYDAWIAVSAAEEARLADEQTERERIAALKVSARAKLIAGQPLTEEEASTIVL